MSHSRYQSLNATAVIRPGIAAFALLVLPLISTQAQPGATIEWGQPLTFQDFQAKPVEQDTAAANISVTIMLGYSSAPDGTLKLKVVAVMNKAESWVRDAFKNNLAVLKHEQGHFDIAHIYAQKLAAGLNEKRYTRNDVEALHAIYDHFLEQMNTVQVRYDQETRGGMDAVAQSKWRRIIAGEIE